MVWFEPRFASTEICSGVKAGLIASEGLLRAASEIDVDPVAVEVDVDVGAVEEEVGVVEEGVVSSVGVVAAVTTCCS